MVSTAKKKILMVEDDESLRIVMKLFFESEGYYFMAVETAEKGLVELDLQEYDIIISDYMLPGINGLEFLRALHKTPVRSTKVLTTAFGNSDIIEQAKSLGISYFIEKPLTAEKLEACLAYLGARQGK